MVEFIFEYLAENIVPIVFLLLIFLFIAISARLEVKRAKKTFILIGDYMSEYRYDLLQSFSQYKIHNSIFTFEYSELKVVSTNKFIKADVIRAMESIEEEVIKYFKELFIDDYISTRHSRYLIKVFRGHDKSEKLKQYNKVVIMCATKLVSQNSGLPNFQNSNLRLGVGYIAISSYYIEALLRDDYQVNRYRELNKIFELGEYE